MPKLRDADTDVGKFIQWVGRKCKNHDPLHELAMSKKRTMVEGRAVTELNKDLPSTYKTKSHADVSALTDEDALIYMFGDRAFKVRVEEVDPVEYEHKQRVKIGY